MLLALCGWLALQLTSDSGLTLGSGTGQKVFPKTKKRGSTFHVPTIFILSLGFSSVVEVDAMDGANLEVERWTMVIRARFWSLKIKGEIHFLTHLSSFSVRS